LGCARPLAMVGNHTPIHGESDVILGQARSMSSLGPVAQLVEHRTFNAVVAGSIPARLTIVFNLSHHLQILSSSLK
jgi:hypothetical protein